MCACLCVGMGVCVGGVYAYVGGNVGVWVCGNVCVCAQSWDKQKGVAEVKEGKTFGKKVAFDSP